jgi:integrase
MPEWDGKWKGGRYYLDKDGRRVFFIEAKRPTGRYTLRLKTHDPDLALGEFARFDQDPVAFVKSNEPKPAPLAPEAVFITADRLNAYMESISSAVLDHRKARRSYLHAWSKLSLDLRTVDRTGLRQALATFGGGHNGRTEALNAFARFLVKQGDLVGWVPLECHREPKKTRAVRVAYSVKQLQAAWLKLKSQPLKDLFLLRMTTGLHHTEVEQLHLAQVFESPLPERGVGIRVLDDKKHKIRGVLQVDHKSGHLHRQSVDAQTLAAALRLRDKGVPHRLSVYKALRPLGLTPSNLRHTFITLAGEVGELVTYSGAGVDRASVARVVGHRAGSTMTADRYERIQVPPMIQLPLKLGNSARA